MESIYTSPRNLVGIGQLPGEVGREREREGGSCRLIHFCKVDSRIDATVNYSLLHVIIIFLRFSFGPSSSNAINARGYHKNKTTNASSVHNRKKRNSDASVASQSRSWYTSHNLPSVYDDEQKEKWMHNLHNRGRRSTSTFDAVALVVSAVQVASCRATVKRKKKQRKRKRKKKRKKKDPPV